ncbi:MAG: LysM peptidoglycan-binding domain-containing protein [Bacteroidales bacterium]|nr:LysM peptidoglycan-binding domain-containing protein [Bacteroidales bacterium]
MNDVVFPAPKQVLKGFLIIAALLVSSIMAAQVPVEMSKQKIVVAGKIFYMHTVQKGQTLYSISKAYNVKVDDITHENVIPENGIKEGQMLKIPASSTPPAADQKASVTKGEVPIPQTNVQTPPKTTPPVTTGAGAATATTASTSASASIPTSTSKSPATQDPRFIYHRVLKGETLSSVSREYGISVRELKKANQGLLFPREGDYLMIPRDKVSVGKAEKQQPQVTEQVIISGTESDTIAVSDTLKAFTVPSDKTVITELRGSVKVAVLLPFFINENSVRSYIDSTKKDSKGKKIYKEVVMPGEWIYEGSIPFIEVYEGILIAVDSLRTLGLTVELDVYDTGGGTDQISNLISSGQLIDVDLIIGPVYSNNLSLLSSWATGHSIPVVSPVPLRDQNILSNRPTLFRVHPSLSVAQDISVAELRSHRGSNIVFLYSDTLMSDPLTSEYWNRISLAMQPAGPDDSTIVTPQYFTGMIPRNDTYRGVSTFEGLLKPDRENIIILATTETPKVSSAFSTLHTLSRKYSVKVMGYPEIRSLETIDLKYYYDLELFIPTESFIDFNSSAASSFIKSFRKNFGTEPMAESFAWRGFDIAFYFIGGIASHGSAFLSDPGIFNPALLCLEPDFRRNSRNDGYENKGMFIMHYRKDMTIEVIKPAHPGY